MKMDDVCFQQKKNPLPIQEYAWHTMETKEVLSTLKTSAEGLSSEEAGRRVLEYGPNEIKKQKGKRWWVLLLEQFNNFLIIILLVAVGISAFLGHAVEAVAITVIVLFAVLLGFIQEFRAERAIEALRKMAASAAKALRDGRQQDIATEAVTIGDIVLLAAGDRIPADMRLIESVSLQVEEAPLTGESVAVEKCTGPIDNRDIAVADTRNMVYAGTTVSYGRGRGVVTGIGMGTQFGKIASLLQSVEAGKTPLQNNLNVLGKTLARIALIIVAVIVVLGIFRGQPFIEMLLFGVALAVAVVPEALPAVVTISLAIGVQRMVKRNALIRRLPAVEALGSTTVICSDKTGTLTKDEMTVRLLFCSGKRHQVSGSGYEPKGDILPPVTDDSPAGEMLLAGLLCSDARLIKKDDLWDIKGDPTEAGLVVAAAKAGLNKETMESRFPRIAEIPFSSEAKRMTTLHKNTARTVAYTKGAYEIILSSCTHLLTDQGVVPLTQQDKDGIVGEATAFTSMALRVLGIARKETETLEDAQNNMCFLGLAGMIDPPRPEVKDAVKICKQAGILPVMITGDHPDTARAIADELGMLVRGEVLSGAQLDRMDDTTLDARVESIGVFARVSPSHKLRLVESFKKKGHIVAMTGDGVNDAPALKRADIGVAMGITGTDVTKEASAMILTDDNFASIVAAVEEGRGIYDNIRKYLMYLLSSNIGEIGLMAGSAVLGLPMPLTAVQILYINLATDGLPALALSVDPQDEDLMSRKPRDPKAGIFTTPVKTLILAGGAWSSLVNLLLFIYMRSREYATSEAMTITFVTLVLMEFVKAYNLRSISHSLFNKPFANKWLNLAILWELLLLGLVVYLPILQKPFHTFSLRFSELMVAFGVALSIIPLFECVKWLLRKKYKNQAEL